MRHGTVHSVGVPGLVGKKVGGDTVGQANHRMEVPPIIVKNSFSDSANDWVLYRDGYGQ
jgi:hypothetical protein